MVDCQFPVELSVTFSEFVHPRYELPHPYEVDLLGRVELLISSFDLGMKHVGVPCLLQANIAFLSLTRGHDPIRHQSGRGFDLVGLARGKYSVGPGSPAASERQGQLKMLK
jgi:hypothetical protein